MLNKVGEKKRELNMWDAVYVCKEKKGRRKSHLRKRWCMSNVWAFATVAAVGHFRYNIEVVWRRVLWKLSYLRLEMEFIEILFGSRRRTTHGYQSSSYLLLLNWSEHTACINLYCVDLRMVRYFNGILNLACNNRKVAMNIYFYISLKFRNKRGNLAD